MCHKSFGSQELTKGKVAAHALSCAAVLFFVARPVFTMLRSGRQMLAAALLLGLCASASADDVLFENVRIFDGKGAALSAPSSVLVQGNLIARISTSPIAAEGAQRIAGNGRTLMPGLIDAHWHAMLIASTPAEEMGDIGFANLAAGDEATDTLMRGFTTVRDVGGPVFGLKRAIDQGIVAGPRIYPSGAMITVTSGHGDFRQLSDLPRTIGGLFTPMERNGGSIVVDSPDEVRLRAREQFMQGAALLKLTAGGGVSSPHSPLDVTTFTEPELRAAVEIAENWGTYVAAHAFTSDAIRKAVAAGVKCIEHGFLMDEATAKLIAEKDVWLSLQPLPELMRTGLREGSVERAKADEVWPGIGRTYELAKKYKIKTAWGTDVLFSRALAKQQGAILASLVRWYTPAEALVMATGTNAELLALSGLRNPYPGKLGVIEEGALADLLLVEGNPLENLDLVADPANNFKIIMKDGLIYKNTLTQ
ncbi:MAG: amidohydrolase family protein [Mesorhizobium sp.]|nr:MAG: amidohydrolase family protein [Mesorhizobium sp.]TIL93490.1 MAG: amidohydrolase family protein [Mesorhizobium sp.]TIM02969.1 MAG: amidohydrolase family protein [Mesorhizobium sp.]